MSYLKMNNAIKFPTLDRTGLSFIDKAANAIRRMFTSNDTLLSGYSYLDRKHHKKMFSFRLSSLAVGL